jgi:putative Ca2+/H+ antiporter (TMEM165/GDT1 family)
MDPKTFALVFGTIFLAELGDKTQIATILFAADGRMGRLNVFAAAALALVVATALNVAVGGVLSHYVSVRHLQVAAGIGFILIGAWTLLHG